MHVHNNHKFQVLLVKPNSLFIPCTLLNTPYMYACFCGSIIQCVVKQPTFAPCHLLFYLTDVADDKNNMPCTLTKIDRVLSFMPPVVSHYSVLPLEISTAQKCHRFVRHMLKNASGHHYCDLKYLLPCY